jgi:hypothetical protein
MTQADIEEMLKNLAETTQYLRETSRIVRASAGHIGAWADAPEYRDVMLKSSDGTWRYIDVRGDTWRLRMTGDPSLPFTIEIESRVTP